MRSQLYGAAKLTRFQASRLKEEAKNTPPKPARLYHFQRWDRYFRVLGLLVYLSLS